MEHYTYHLAVYSKLIRGHDPSGPIKKGVEARLTGKSKDFPANLNRFCSTTSFFKDAPRIVDIDPGRTPGGVFVYRPTYLGGRHYSIFARIEARSEDGKARAGRRFTHCALLFVEDKWEPELIPWAAEMLFTDQIGDRCWGEPAVERDADRQNWKIPVLARDDLQYDVTERLLNLRRDSAGKYLCRGSMPPYEREESPYPIMARELADFLHDSNLATHGRWLNIALGVGNNVEPHTQRFFIRYDGRKEEGSEGSGLSLKFDDEFPPTIEGNFAAVEAEGRLPVIDWSYIAPKREGGVIRDNMFSEDNLWPDQIADELQGGSKLAPSASREADDTDEAVFRAIAESRAISGEEVLDIALPSFLDRAAYVDDDQFVLEPWLNTSKLAATKPAFNYMIASAQMLDPTNGFFVYAPPMQYERVIDAFVRLFLFTFSYAAVGNVNDLRPHIERLLEHEALPKLEIEANAIPGIIQHFFVRMIDAVGVRRIHDHIEGCHRVEQGLKHAMVNQGELDRGYIVYAPQRQTTESFLEWLRTGSAKSEEFNGNPELGKAIMGCFSEWNDWIDEASAEVIKRITV